MSRRGGAAVDPLGYYLRTVRRLPRLPREEERRLARRIGEGRQARVALAEPDLSHERRRVLEERERQGREARDQLVLANLRLALHIARAFHRRGRLPGLELSDLIQEGNLGLLLAAEKLEAGSVRFSRFAPPWIRLRIDRARVGRGPFVRIPVGVHEMLKRLRQEDRWYLAEKGRPPTPEELAAELGIDTEELAKLRGAETEVVSLDQPLEDAEEESLFEDLVEDPQSLAFARRTLDRQWLARLLSWLDERSRRILVWHHGYDVTLEEIGRRENVSRQRVRQIVGEALEKVRAFARRN